MVDGGSLLRRLEASALPPRDFRRLPPGVRSSRGPRQGGVCFLNSLSPKQRASRRRDGDSADKGDLRFAAARVVRVEALAAVVQRPSLQSAAPPDVAGPEFCLAGTGVSLRHAVQVLALLPGESEGVHSLTAHRRLQNGEQQTQTHRERRGGDNGAFCLSGINCVKCRETVLNPDSKTQAADKAPAFSELNFHSPISAMAAGAAAAAAALPDARCGVLTAGELRVVWEMF